MNDWTIELMQDVAAEKAQIQETIKLLTGIRNEISLNRSNYTVAPAIGTYLMNFYNGVENILKRICKSYYQVSLLKGSSWHKELLVSAYQAPNNKISILTNATVEKLYQYKDFRHRFISGYGFQLKIEKMLELMDDLGPLWNQIDDELNIFFKNLTESAP